MRNRNLAVIAGLAMVMSLGLLGTAAAEDVTFTLTNGTSFTMTEFYASPPSEGSWEEDILGDDVLDPGDSVSITIMDGREDCMYDFLAVFEDDYGNEVELEHEEVEICDGESYTYTD